MAELTIHVSDELAQRLKPLQDNLPDLLTQLVASLSPRPGRESGETRTEPPHSEQASVYTEVLDLLLSRPSPQAIVAFKVSDTAQDRLRTLLDKNREEGLTDGETAELDLYEQLEQLLILLKAKAQAVLQA